MQLSLLPRFDGADYNHARDGERLNTQLARIVTLMADGQWRTLEQIKLATGDPEASISAQLRNLRKARFGRMTVERKHVGFGLYQYRVMP